MVDAKSQLNRRSPSGPIGDRKITATVGGKGTTIAKAASTSITLNSTQVPGLAGVKATDVVGANFKTPGDANVSIGGCYVTGPAEINLRFVNPTAGDVTDYTATIEFLVYPFNI
jgi:hypothetical protein